MKVIIFTEFDCYIDKMGYVK
jgi:hypothetical protein